MTAVATLAGCGSSTEPGPPPPPEPGTPRPAPASAREAPVRCTPANAQRQMSTVLDVSFRDGDEGVGSITVGIADGWCGKHAGRSGLVAGKLFGSSAGGVDHRASGEVVGASTARRTGRYLARLHQVAYGVGCQDGEGRPLRVRLARGIRARPPAAEDRDSRVRRTRGGATTWTPVGRCVTTGTFLVEVGYSRGAKPRLLAPILYFGGTTDGPRIAVGPGGDQRLRDPDGSERAWPLSPRARCTSASAEDAGVCDG